MVAVVALKPDVVVWNCELDRRLLADRVHPDMLTGHPTYAFQYRYSGVGRFGGYYYIASFQKGETWGDVLGEENIAALVKCRLH